MNNFLLQVSGIVWGPLMLVLLVGTGIYLTIRLRFLQLRRLGYALKLIFAKSDSKDEGDISHFQALMTALAATVGTGNIVGVAGAVSIGGPGALFWMWITALFGMATKYGEAILAVKYRVVDENGNMNGGPMYALERGLGQKWLGVLFAIFGSVAAFGIGNMVQANSVAVNVQKTFGAPLWGIGIVLAIVTALVIFGGVQSIGRVTGWLVPFMAVFYIVGALIIILVNIREVPAAIGMVFKYAFTPTAASGGFLGATVMLAMQKGVSRGVFSNEAGLGSAPIAAAAAKTDIPARQALVSMTGTFIDTIVICTLTGLSLLVTGVWNSGADTGILTSLAFDHSVPVVGGYIVGIGIILFAYSTILGWEYYGERCVEYIFGIKAITPYRFLWVIAVLVGSVAQLDVVWNFADVMNALMAIPNLVSLIFLSGVIVVETKAFLEGEAKS